VDIVSMFIPADNALSGGCTSRSDSGEPFCWLVFEQCRHLHSFLLRLRLRLPMMPEQCAADHQLLFTPGWKDSLSDKILMILNNSGTFYA